MSAPDDGFEFTVRKKREHVPLEPATAPPGSGLDKSLDEIAVDERARRRENPAGRDTPKGGDREKRRIITELRLPRSVIAQIAENQGIDIEGYHVRVEAVLTKRS